MNVSYRVLARKYRPVSFNDLVGQDVLVKTFKNAFENNRIYHAYMLSGVRGVGKTTTARLIARSLNCIGVDGNGEMSIDTCNQCEQCNSISAGSNVDVIEIDAASHTGVSNIREIIDNVRYKPVSSRYKVYIIDEVHMLSTAAFNALLKTLEEPPPSIVFILATTEIRKVPVTVMSRCQRFDLKRLQDDEMCKYLLTISQKESVTINKESLSLIARVSEGSIRDGLSLLDQGISFCGSEIKEHQIRDLLGLSDRGKILDIFEFIMSGDVKSTLSLVRELYNSGSDCFLLIQDLMHLCHSLTLAKVTDSDVDDLTLSESMKLRAKNIIENIQISDLTKTWQLLLKGLNEASFPVNNLYSLEMLLIRVAYAADLPDPAKLVKLYEDSQRQDQKNSKNESGFDNLKKKNINDDKDINKVKILSGIEDIVKLAEEKKEYILRTHLISNVHVINFELGRIIIRLNYEVPADFVNLLGKFLNQETGIRWHIELSNEAGDKSIKEKNEIKNAELIKEASSFITVKKVLGSFPGSEVKKVIKLN
ncbi:DNA polymerase III subunit gamma/tau [Alphaproteobacteria bacterium]|nr:DNA polymerase III subunit gamma/tau [Alphaproteobacteria bacterium]